MSKGKGKKRSTKKVRTIEQGRIAFLSYLGDMQGCGTIRCIYPYLLLNHFRTPKIQMFGNYMSEYIWEPNYYKGYTIVQFQRSATKRHLELYRHFKSEVQKAKEIPMVYEIDDMLIGIPEWNYAHEYYVKCEDYIKEMMGMSDAMVTSTYKLKQIYSQYNKNISVIPNHLPKFMWGETYQKHINQPRIKRPRILWAGSQNHFADKRLLEKGVRGGDFGPELIDFIKKTTDKFEWYIMGGWPHELEPVRDKIHKMPWKNIFEYPSAMKAIDADICIAPLEDNVFNSAKSNIKQLEFSACGAAGVYSHVEPYKNSYLTSRSDEEMISYIEDLAVDVDLRGKVWNKDWQLVKDQIWWEENNNIRKYINTYLKLFGMKLPK